MSGLEKLISDAEKMLNKAIQSENWSEANTKQGYYDGMTDLRDATDYQRDLKTILEFAEWNLNGLIRQKEWGKSAYWRSYISGYSVAETAYRLEILEKQS